jgi:hypothetical protein
MTIDKMTVVEIIADKMTSGKMTEDKIFITNNDCR